jgi:outer membrane protein OmpA-like peptidoglycan-associated protein
MKHVLPTLALAGILALGLGGCASRGYVDQQIYDALNAEINLVRTDMEAGFDEIRDELETHADELNTLKSEVRENRELVEEALERAKAAEKVESDGKLLYEVVISDESLPFAFDKSELSAEAKEQLDIFAGVLIDENDDVYIEIQGHTDNIGSEEYNLELGRERAQSVLSYLHERHDLPLHRMDTYSYGESKPVADNDTAENRARNRRVMLMVLE